MKKSNYLQLLEDNQMIPNFWCSREYFQKAGLEEIDREGILYVYDDDVLVFPPISSKGILKDPSEMVWCDLEGLEFTTMGYVSEFLDYEYIYDPKTFLTMEGKSWMVFRKNSRKFPRRVNEELEYVSDISNRRAESIFLEWLNIQERKEIYDDETMIKFIFEGENRRFLRSKKGKIYGLNIWDENFQYINYRYCICGKEDFISEYMRLLFYTDSVILNKGKLVNDGGVLDNPKLRFFKDKLNPMNYNILSIFYLKV